MTKLTYQQWSRQEGPFLKLSRDAAGVLVGTGKGMMTGVVTACVGGAHGMAEGAQVEPSETFARTASDLNLGAVGVATAEYAAVQFSQPSSVAAALGVAALGAATAINQGRAVWNGLPDTTQSKVIDTAQQWTRKVVPAQDDPTQLERVVGGATGEVVGAAAGALVGFTDGFGLGQLQGFNLVDSVQKAIYTNMHG